MYISQKFKLIFTACLIIFAVFTSELKACSVVYYVDQISGKIYVANNEDYWYDKDAYIQIIPSKKNQYARLWYGWNNFAQGGINSAGLFFDGAVTPDQKTPTGFGKPKGNLGDELLANCQTVEQALDYVQKKEVALTNAHMMFGDSTGNAVVVEWIDGERKLNWIKNNKLVMTNFLLSDTTAGNYPCYRFKSIEDRINILQESNNPATFRDVGNTLGQAAQSPQQDKTGKTGGTLYSTFIDISEMEFILVYKLDNSKITKLNLREEFDNNKKRKIKLQ